MTEPRARVRNASDREQLRRAKRSERLEEAQREADLAVVMSTPNGRRFIWWLLKESGNTSSVLRQGLDLVLFCAGKQDFGHMLLLRLTKEIPEQYLLMQREAIEAEKREPDAPFKQDESAVTEDTLAENPEE